MASEKPILFNSEMVRAILDGRKTQTRRVIKPQPDGRHCRLDFENGVLKESSQVGGCWHVGRKIKCPYGKPGDRLWVRETWGYLGSRWDSDKPDMEVYYTKYWADEAERSILLPRNSVKKPRPTNVPNESEDLDAYHSYWRAWWNRQRKKPSIHMPRWASRITLEITNIRVERVQDITVEDMAAEGIINLGGGTMAMTDCWIELWDSINAKRGYGWAENSWVWVIGFRKAVK